MIVSMGIGRFAFTPIMPIMVDNGLLSEEGAGYLASSNYFGYLIGAIFTMFVKDKNRGYFLIGGLLCSFASTGGMGMYNSFDAWFVLRFVSGLASAVVFIITSSMILEELTPIQSGGFYSGVGLGILITGLVVPVFSRVGNWSEVWVGLGYISLILAFVSWYFLTKNQNKTFVKSLSLRHNQQNVANHAPKLIICLIIAYGLEGMGYIVTGTYLVAFAKTVSDIPNLTSFSWILVGISAAPSCILWTALANRWGKLRTLIIAMVVQAIGIGLPVVVNSLTSVIIGALLFGVTFMGITTLSIALAKDYTTNHQKIIALLTSSYGLGQVIGPLVAGFLISRNQTYTSAILGAAVIILLGVMVFTFSISDFRKLSSVSQTSID
ncbi:YbfB/YjiJ family MFS transporter [Paenibacillus sp. 8b26]|uniref:YbfB/YjiJ family MFS transporter n=1 Tax=Paenibacillus sp. 8b26 TaxID=3424133 RepID=UPI003D65DF33